ncbi:MAG: CoA-binding protein [Alphaproteobacteria bacterium]|nr:CoA-binding protein [Alphaproteobacteria bacterium]
MTTTLAHHDGYADDHIRKVLKGVKTIAMVGASTNWNRPSYFAMKYLQQKGYRVIPVNPSAAGEEILGEKVMASLAEIPVPVDMVDVFRNSAAAGPIADQAIAIGAKVLWMQLGVRNDEAAARAEKAGLTVIMNRCPKIEYGRLCGELGWHGFNSGVISSKRRKE